MFWTAGRAGRTLLSTGAAFGTARLILHDGHGAGLLGFISQGLA